MRKPGLLLAAAFLLAGCSSAGTVMTGVTPPPSASPLYPASWVLPDRSLSPGVAAVGDVTRLCPHVDPALEAARPDSREKAAVYRAYGLSYPQAPGKYELDHVVPIELGGAPDDPQNMYPEPNDTPDPAMIARYHLNPAFIHNSKDIVEDVLHADVCSFRVPLAVAAQAMATDWRAAYVRYVGPPVVH